MPHASLQSVALSPSLPHAAAAGEARHAPLEPVPAEPAPRSLKALTGRILKSVGQANREFGLLAEGDRVLVALSGGKDSYGMLWALQHQQKTLPIRIELFAYHLDQGQPGHDTGPIERHMQAVGVPYEVEYQDTYTRVVEKTAPGKIYCSLCSRFRRAILYKAALRHGCNKVALGHHRDDLIETLLLNVFFAGQIKSMPARLTADEGGLQVIRPLAFVEEDDLALLAERMAFAIVPCRLCGSQLKERAYIKTLLRELSARSPHVKGNLLHALKNVVPSHLLDGKLNPHCHGSKQALQETMELGATPLVPTSEFIPAAT